MTATVAPRPVSLLPLTLLRDSRPPALGVALEALRPTAETQPALPVLAEDPPPTPASVPEADIRIATTFTRLLVEALQGRRSPALLEPHMAPRSFTLLLDLRGEGVRPRLALRSTRVQAPAGGVLEIALHLTDAGRSTAVALRLEHHERWTCSALEVALAHEGVRRCARDRA